MATNNAINIQASGLCNYDGAGTFTGVTLTQHAMLVGGASNNITSQLLTNGQLMIGNTGSDPSAATLTAGTGMSITNASGSITLNAIGGGLTWTDVTGTSQAGAVNNGYLADNAGLVTITLPTTAPQFSLFAVAGLGVGGWKIAQNAGQSIQFGSAAATTSGVTGSLASTNRYDVVYLLAVVGGASTTWLVLGSVGNLTIV